MLKADSERKKVDDNNYGDKNELSYWKYPARKMNRAVSEPNLHRTFILGTRVLQNKSNSFHNLTNFKQHLPVAAESFKPKLITWLYVTKGQCISINFTKTDSDLLKVFSKFLDDYNNYSLMSL